MKPTSYTFQTDSTLNAEYIQYQTQGFCVVDEEVLSHSEMTRLANGTYRVMAGNYTLDHPPKFSNYQPENFQSFQQVKGLHLCDEDILSILHEDKLVRRIASILGANSLRILETAIFIKPGFGDPNGEIPWHRDGDYMKYIVEGMAHIWIPLEPINAINGTLQYLPGTHLQHRRIPQPLPISEQDSIHEEYYRMMEKLEESDRVEMVPVDIPWGGFSMHHGDTIHGSGPNYAPTTRHAFAFTVVTEDLKVDPQGFDGVQLGHLHDLDDPIICPKIL